ncbi:MAG: FliH/SctL family protein [Pseudomonadota bacterium]
MSDRKRKLKPGDMWVPLDVSLLETCGQEKFQHSERTELDFDLFKVLYEIPEFREEDRFRELYDPDADDSPLSRLPGSRPSGGQTGPDKDLSGVNGTGSDADAPPEKDPGFDEGFAQGRTQGYDIGFEQGRKKGYDDGFKKGEAESRAQEEKKSRAIIASLEIVLSTMETHWERLVREDEDKILKLICQIAEKVVLATVAMDQDVVRLSVLKALESLPEPEDIVLNVSPEDYEYIETIKEDFFDMVKSLTRISVISNASVTRGGCVVETSDARVKTDLESRLEAVFASILDGGEI